jgi:glycosyltransferase involved in cell wall biosynthesis
MKMERMFRFAIHLAGDLVPVESYDTAAGIVYTIVAKVAVLNADILYIISPKLEELIKSKYRIPSRTRLIQVPIGVEVPKEPRQWNSPTDGVKFGVVARLTKPKGIHFAIESLAVLLEENLQASLLIYGDGPFRQELERTVEESGIVDHVEFMGWTDDPLRALHGIDCLLLPSKGEGTPRSILEAASIGVPSIATDVGGIGDIIDDSVTGWVVPYGDSDALSNAMRSVVRDFTMLMSAGIAAREKLMKERSVATEVGRLLKEGGS